MSVTTDGIEMTDGARTALRRYSESHHGDLSDVEAFAQTLYNAGFRDSITAAVEFQDLPREMRRIEDYVTRVCRVFEAHGVVS